MKSVLPTCNEHITNHIQKLLHFPQALLIPCGRAYVAKNFGVSLYIHRINDEIFGDAVPEYLTVSGSVELEIRSCSLPETVPDLIRGNELGACDISFYARMVGHSIFMGYATPLNITDVIGCAWKVQFEEIIFAGVYRLEVFMMWLNELDEPDEQTRSRTKTDRMNDGMIVTLSGIGNHPFFILNASLHYYHFDGYFVKQIQGRDHFLLLNGTKYPFINNNQILKLGFHPENATQFPAVLLNYLPTAIDPLPTFSDPIQLQEWKNSIPTPIQYRDINEILHKITQVTVCDVDSRPRSEASMFNLPSKGLVVKLPVSTVFKTHKNMSRDLLPLCSNPKEIAVGYWNQDPSCQSIETLFKSNIYRKQLTGHECLHHLQPVYNSRSIELKTHRGRYYVWKPANCHMIQFRLNALIDPNLDYCENLKQFVRNPLSPLVPVPEMDSQKILLKETERFHFKTTVVDNTIPVKPLYYIPSLAQFAMRKAGIGLLAGFGDSLGDELRDNILQLFGGGTNINKEKDKEWHPGNGIRCMNGGTKYHKLIHPELPHSSPLVDCITNFLPNLPKKFPLIQEIEKIPFNNYFLKHPEEEIAKKNKFLIQPNEIIPVKTIVLVTNFMCQHSVWIHTLTEIENALKQHAKLHANLANKLFTEYNITYRRIFYTGIAVHGFKTGGLTPARSRKFNQMAIDILGPTGWEVLDSYALTITRPEGAVDGIHYRGGVSMAITDVFMNMITNNGVCT